MENNERNFLEVAIEPTILAHLLLQLLLAGICLHDCGQTLPSSFISHFLRTTNQQPFFHYLKMITP